MDGIGLQAVHCAAKGGHIEALRLLKESECDLTTRTPRGATTLHCAAEGGHVAAVQWLLEHSGLSLDSLNNDGETALDVARRNGHHNTIVHLLEARHQRDVKKLQDEMKEKEFEITKLAADLKVKEELRKVIHHTHIYKHAYVYISHTDTHTHTYICVCVCVCVFVCVE
ncbi:cyclin-dependent kinase 4 inhibitor C-like, partial [Penaeus monodon]|uniref:cyclin-dependent kinase 4 inhibitor C-like n=1 Tax=Penaeus monodon TaxID=6687 RepID=UPI0018A6DC88